MLKIKAKTDLKDLEKYGFKREPEHQYYYKKISNGEIFIWSVRGNDYSKGDIYIELEQYEMLVSELDTIYDLIKDGLVEKVED